MNKYVVEHEYKDQPLTDERHDEEGRRADPCLAQYGVKWKASYLAEDRTRMICEFEAETQENIVNALRSAEVAFVRVWPAHRYSAKE